MKGPDLDRERSEKKVTRPEFLKLYNEGLPESFPRASTALLGEYQDRYASQFKDGAWSLDLHRKKFMDWLPGYLKSLEPHVRRSSARATVNASTSARPEK